MHLMACLMLKFSFLQLVDHVLDSMFHRELKQFVCCQYTPTQLDGCGEAIRWERWWPAGGRERSYSLPSIHGLPYGVHGHSC